MTSYPKAMLRRCGKRLGNHCHTMKSEYNLFQHSDQLDWRSRGYLAHLICYAILLAYSQKWEQTFTYQLWTKWLTFCRRRYQLRIHWGKVNCRNFSEKKLREIWQLNYNESIIDYTQNSRHFTAGKNGDPVYWRAYASPFRLIMMAWWYGNASHIICHLWGKSTDRRRGALLVSLLISRTHYLTSKQYSHYPVHDFEER